MKKKVLILHGHSSIEIFHTLVPLHLLASTNSKYTFKFKNYKIPQIHNTSADVLILVRKYHDYDLSKETLRNEIIEDIKQYKKKYKKVVYFDDSAALSHILFFMIPYIDSYWVRGLLKDKNLYQNKYFGGRTYSDYYLRKYGLKDEFENFNPSFNFENQNKIKIAWNIGIGCFPIFRNTFWNRNYYFIKKLSCILSLFDMHCLIRKIIGIYISQMKLELKRKINNKKKLFKIGARFSSSTFWNSTGFQRKLALQKISHNDFFISGKLNFWKYLEECSQVIGLLSPFGWGEICYRDFEAALSENLLIKPNVDHIETWPNLFNKNSYYSLDWEFNNLDSIEKYIYKNKDNIYAKIANSRMEYLDALNECTFRAEKLIDQVLEI
jgi:hypothetical protein